VKALMGAEADAVCGAPSGARRQERVDSRNGYRRREWDTRAGTMELAIPKLRSGSYLPDWLLERRKRAERALTTVVATCYLLAVSTQRMEKLVEALRITRPSKSQGQHRTRSLLARSLARLEAAQDGHRQCRGEAGRHCRRQDRVPAPWRETDLDLALDEVTAAHRDPQPLQGSRGDMTRARRQSSGAQRLGREHDDRGRERRPQQPRVAGDALRGAGPAQSRDVEGPPIP